MAVGWRTAMTRALYGPGGFFVTGAGPAAHFRTSVHASPVFGAALLRLVEQVDAALGHPDRLDVVDVGAGRGELLTTLARLVARSPAVSRRADPTAPPDGRPAALLDRLRLTGVELAPRPPDLPAPIGWRDRLPEPVTGLLLATEWLDNVPLDVAVAGGDGWRTVLVDPAGHESVGGPVDPADAAWLDAWWPGPVPGGRAEIGRPRDLAWADAVRAVDRGLALAVDYGHLRASRPVDGTLTGYRNGRQVPPVPDGSCDLTAHVAVDAVAAAGDPATGTSYALLPQRDALRLLGADGGRPPLALAGTDPAGYLRALATASAVTELTDPAGLGGHWWLVQPVGVPLPFATPTDPTRVGPG
ncbi:SAM-dependent methyltransferase [Micromonospora cathayae]|uniref:SAM-dependent methyltransferase n=1 Tax=Micromonospora cathayae TaxID=3028804 RepID=A0ABY7ZS45_9ACTN|nr:SAM-dependent methyltransferase [Micromonospora sp. HUAS 3]WDZ85693.1 SAM-dependent methyltransferase [Micromonospora sp. HUAS 3]